MFAQFCYPVGVWKDMCVAACEDAPHTEYHAYNYYCYYWPQFYHASINNLLYFFLRCFFFCALRLECLYLWKMVLIYLLFGMCLKERERKI